MKHILQHSWIQESIQHLIFKVQVLHMQDAINKWHVWSYKQGESTCKWSTFFARRLELKIKMLCDDIIWKFSPFIWILNHNIEEQTHEGVHIGVCDSMTNAWNVGEEENKPQSED